ncbi:hypothetical protein [Streptomyces klenkii]
MFILLAALHSPPVFPRSVGAQEAQEHSAVDSRPIVYWWSGCKYCLRLRIRSGRNARGLRWAGIRRDWHQLGGGGSLPGVGHDPVSPIAERFGDTVRLTVNAEQSGSPVIELPGGDLRRDALRGDSLDAAGKVAVEERGPGR